MPTSLIIWASDIPGLDLTQEIVHPEDKSNVGQKPEILDWWKSLAFTALYCVGTGAEWIAEPSIEREKNRILVTGQVSNPSPWVETGNLSLSVKPAKDKGYACTLWYEDASLTPAPMERSWFCYAPKGAEDRIDRLVTSISDALLAAFTDYSPSPQFSS